MLYQQHDTIIIILQMQLNKFDIKYVSQQLIYVSDIQKKASCGDYLVPHSHRTGTFQFEPFSNVSHRVFILLMN